MSEATIARNGRPELGSCVLVSVAVFVGWAPQDLALMGVTAEPGLCWKLLPAAVATVAPKALLLALLGVAIAGWFVKRMNFPLATTGVTIGAIMAAAFVRYMMYREDLDYSNPALSLELIWILAAIGGLVLGRVSDRTVRILAQGLCVALPLAYTLYPAAAQVELPRSHKALASDAVDQDAPNLVFIVLDTVRADHLAPYEYGRITTPDLDAFVREGVTLYTQARSTSSWTLPSHASLFTGLYPSEHAALSRARVRY